MANKRQSGNRFQDWCQKWIIENYPGSVVHNQKTVSKMIKAKDPFTGKLRDIWISKRNDLFGCIDLVAIVPGRRVLFIQVTMDTSVEKRRKELMKVPWPECCADVELWQKKSPREINIKKFLPGGTFRDHGKILNRKFYLLGDSPAALENQGDLF